MTRTSAAVPEGRLSSAGRDYGPEFVRLLSSGFRENEVVRSREVHLSVGLGQGTTRALNRGRSGPATNARSVGSWQSRGRHIGCQWTTK